MGRLTHTVSGSIASLRTPSRVPIESLKFHFLPKQASGTPSPENPIPIEGWTGLNGRRAGKNIGHVMWSTVGGDADAVRKLSNNYGTSIDTLDFVNPDGRIVVTQTKWDNPSLVRSYMNGYVAPIVDTLQRDMYYDISFKVTNIVSNPLNASLSDMALSDPYGMGYVNPIVKDNVVIFRNYKHICKDTYPNRKHFELRTCGMSCTISELMVTPANSSDGVYVPYSGEQIPITFPVAGTNKLDPNDIDVYARFELVNGVYRNTDVDTRTTIQLSVQLWKTTGTYIKTAKVDYVTTIGRHAITFDVDEPECQYIVLKHNGMKKDFILIFPRRLGFGTFTISCDVLANDPTTIGGVQLTNIQLEVGDTAHAFEPYSSDNTFYGGYIDPVAGEIVAEYALAVAKKENFGEKITPTSGGMECRQTGNIYSPTESGVTWSVARQQQKFNFGVIANPWSETAYGNNIGVVITQSNYNLTYMRISETVYQAMGNDDLATISYKLETPIHIPIPAEDMKAFLDHNNFWSDANDVTEVTYPVTESRDILATRKRIMSQTWDMIPLKYQPVEYISAKDSNPYIDMGIQLTGECEVEVHYYNDKSEAFLFGARKGASSTPYCNFNVESASANRSRFDYGNQKATASSGLPFAGYHDGEYIFKFHSRTATMEKVSTGEVVTKDYSSFTRTDYSDYNMLLFSVNTNGTPSLNTGTGELRVYSAKFWLGGQLVRDFVPCVRKSDSKPGMYDRVSKTFFINAGSGEFVIPT